MGTLSTKPAIIRAIYHYPVKGLSAEPLPGTTLSPRATVVGDRCYAIENGPSGFDAAAPAYLPKQRFLMLMKNERLARLDTCFDDAAQVLAIRENERRARFLGIPVDRHIWLSWVISCLFVSLAGTLYALLNNFADPHDLRWDQSGDFVIMAVLGGMRAFWGPLIGAAIFVVLQDYLSSETANWMSFIGLFFVLVVLFFPRGVLGVIQRKAAP